MRRVWLVHNSRAGRAGLLPQVEAAANALARQGVDVRLVRDPALPALRQAAREAVAAQADAVLVAGGDGTLGALAGELAHTPVAFGALAAGTANVWARANHLPRPSLLQPHTLERAALALLDAPTRLTDLGRANDAWFLTWAGLGLDADAVQQFERRRDGARPGGGFLYNGWLTLGAARQLRGLDLRLAVSGPAGEREVAGRFLMATVCAIGLHGGGLFRLAPEPDPADGQMDLWAWRGDDFGAALAHAGRVLLGRHAAHPDVVRLTGSRFDLYTAAPQAFHLDGEPQPAPAAHLSIAVVPRCLRVLTPRPAPATTRSSPA
jgi:diacylglycerol kinase family enzyme